MLSHTLLYSKVFTDSCCSSGIDEADMTEVQKLTTSVAKLQELKPNKQTKTLYSRTDRSEADAIRAGAVLVVEDSDNSEDDSFYGFNSDLSNLDEENSNIPQSLPSTSNTHSLRKSPATATHTSRQQSSAITTNTNLLQGSRAANATNSSVSRGITTAAEQATLNMFFSDGGMEEDDPSEQFLSNKATGRPTPKRELVRYLEKKTEVICIL